MKFDFAIGNPPYQDETLGDNKGFAPPVYHKFLEEAYKIAENVEMIHPARFLFNAGSTPKKWNEKMLADPHSTVKYYEQDSNKVFANTDIKGGVAITYRDMQRNYGAIEVFAAFPELNSIKKKVAPKLGELSLADIIYTQNRFELETFYADYPEFKEIIGSKGKDRRFRNNIFEDIPDTVHSVIEASKVEELEGSSNPLGKLKKTLHTEAIKIILETAKEQYDSDMRPADKKRLEGRMVEEADKLVDKAYLEYSIAQRTLEA